MHLDIKRAEAPIEAVILTLTPHEWHDLQVLAHADTFALDQAFSSAEGVPATTSGGQTYDRYGLIRNIRKLTMR